MDPEHIRIEKIKMTMKVGKASMINPNVHTFADDDDYDSRKAKDQMIKELNEKLNQAYMALQRKACSDCANKFQAITNNKKCCIDMGMTFHE